MEVIDYDSFQYYTFDDYQEWEGRWELIEGVAYSMAPSPCPKHQKIVARICRELDIHLVCSRKECEIYISPIDWKISESTVVQPDVALFCEDTEVQFFSKTPPLVVEVLSKATALKDVTTKKDLYEREGVLFYIIVEPHAETADIFKLIEGKYQHIGKYTKEERCELEISNECRSAIDFSKVF